MTNDIKAIADGLSELLPCPFCGAAQAVDKHAIKGVWVEAYALNEPEFQVLCWTCGAAGTARATRADAIAAWNTRSITTLEAENASLREALATIAARNFNCSVHQHGMAAAGLAERTLLALSTQGTTDKDSPDGDA